MGVSSYPSRLGARCICDGKMELLDRGGGEDDGRRQYR